MAWSINLSQAIGAGSPIEQAVAATVALAGSAPVVTQQSGGGGGATFDYFMSPTGDDNNAGTLTSPWSLSAFNSKSSTYAGKNVGLIADQGTFQHSTIGGVQTTIYAAMMASSSGVIFRINGGTASKSTYVAACSSSGVYLPPPPGSGINNHPYAIIDASQPGTGTLPVSATAMILGQAWYSTTPPANPGYVTLDGIWVKNGNYACVIFGDIQPTIVPGVLIQNCEIGPSNCSTSSENPGGLFLGSTLNAKILNTKIHDCTNTSGFVPGTGGITTYASHGIVVTGCAFWNNAYAIQNKDSNQDGVYSYNYFDTGTFGSLINQSYSTGNLWPNPASGVSHILHHNIFVGGGIFAEQAGGGGIAGAIVSYNNTYYGPVAGSNGLYPLYVLNTSSSGPHQWYNNLVYAVKYGTNQGGTIYGAIAVSSSQGVSGANWGNNYYGTGMTFGIGAAMTFAQMQAAGYESGSAEGGNPFSGTPAFMNPNSFAISGVAASTGRGGTQCGAADGSGPIGPNF